MDDTNTSNKRSLEIEAISSLQNVKQETYRPLDSSTTTENQEKSDPQKRESMVRDSKEIRDGADEKMLDGAGDGDHLAEKQVEIKFISGTPTNGDAQIDIGDGGNGNKPIVTGLTKEELMKYANDPFWVKLRWILFIGFWALWVGMFIGAIYIIIQTPKCLPPEPHSWYKTGPLVAIDTLEEPSADILRELKENGVQGVIYKLPADETYSLKNLGDIKKVSEAFKESEIDVIMDVTATYVLENDELYQEALKNRSALEAFVFTESTAPNWVSFEGTPAFKEVKPGLNVLSQYGTGRYDLRMNHEIVKEKLKNVLKQLVENGVKGVRLDKTRHFIIDNDLSNESPNSEVTNYQNNEYPFWTHTHTTLRDGLGELLAEYSAYFHNITDNKGFLSTVDDIVRPEVYKFEDALGVDIPHYGRVNYLLDQNPINLGQVRKELEENFKKISAYRGWVQYPYDTTNFKNIEPSEYTIFTFLLPGVPVPSLKALNFGNNSKELVKDLEVIRESPSCMHGTFQTYVDLTNQTLGYTRYKSGNPGYFVVLNPNPIHVVANFSNVENMSPELKVHLLSDNFKLNSTLKAKEKVKAEALDLPPKSAGIFTYVAAN